MKHISKKEFDRFYTIMKNNPGKSVLEITFTRIFTRLT